MGELKEKIETKLQEKRLEDNYMVLSNRLDIPNLLYIIDCFVFFSKYEWLPVTLIDAKK